MVYGCLFGNNWIDLFAEDPVVEAQKKLENSIRAAKALTNIEKELGTDPAFIEQKTGKLKKELGSEMKNINKLESQQDEPSKKSKYKNMKDVVKEDMKEAQSILSLIVKLEAAKYLANERARQKLVQVQRNRINKTPPLPAVSAVPPQPTNQFQPPYMPPMLPSYVSSYQSSSYPQYAGSYPGTGPFQDSQQSWSGNLGMNQGINQGMNQGSVRFAMWSNGVKSFSSGVREGDKDRLEGQNSPLWASSTKEIIARQSSLLRATPLFCSLVATK